MSNDDSSLDAFVNEFRASLSYGQGEDVLRRINAERTLRMVVEKFAEEASGHRVRLLADKRVAGAAGADFLLQVDDYDIRLELNDAPGGRPQLPLDQLAAFEAMLEDNPTTVALVVVWSTDELLSIPFSIRRITFLAENPDQLTSLLKQATPLKLLLPELTQKQVKSWEAPTSPSNKVGQRPEDMRRLFFDALTEAMNAAAAGSYRIPARKEAARRFPLREERQVIMKALELALEGIEGDSLTDALSKTHSRGGR